MAKPIYGGWVTFTAHLCLKHNCNLFKIGKKNEKNKRKFLDTMLNIKIQK